MRGRVRVRRRRVRRVWRVRRVRRVRHVRRVQRMLGACKHVDAVCERACVCACGACELAGCAGEKARGAERKMEASRRWIRRD